VSTVLQALMSLPAAGAICVACLVGRTGLRPAEVSQQLETLGEQAHSATEGACIGCFDGTPVFRYERE
jgi:hypothetical protein